MINKKYITFRREPFFEIAKELIGSESVVLDLGAGKGTFSDYCNRSDFYLYDGNPDTINFLRRKHKNVYEGDLPILPFQSEFFDVIHCSHIVEHLKPKMLYETLREMDRCLKPTGHIIISAPMMWEGFYDDLSHVKPYNPSVFINYLCDENAENRTRSKVSNNYRMEKIIFRYREVKVLDTIFIPRKSLKSRIVTKILEKLSKIILNYEKTGYTLVLKKDFRY